MKRWKNKSILETYLVVLVLTFITTVGSIYIYMLDKMEAQNKLADLIIFVMTIISVLIALLAYHISVKTYISIDAVNAMSRMDGNVMENENYRTGIFALIRNFSGKDREEAGEALIRYIEKAFNKRKNISGAKLADSIQEVIDIMVLLSMVIKPEHKKDTANENQLYIKRLKTALRNIEKKVDVLDEISEGSCILIKESVKLVRAVISYQLFTAGCGDVNKVFLLMDVRGSMLKNAISRTIYYNYIGLLYLKKGSMAIQESTDFVKNGIYTIRNIRQLSKIKGTAHYELAVVYLHEAIVNFNKAVSEIEDEIMWNSFIQYNKARVQFLIQEITGYRNNEWKVTMNKAIIYRGRLNMVLEDIIDTESSYFQRAFRDQLKLAKLMKIRFEIAGHEDITNEIGDSILPTNKYEQLTNATCMDIGKDEFLRLGHVKEDILANLQ